MKKFQKIVAVGAAFAMAMSMGVSAFAEDAVEGFVADVTHELAEDVETYSTLKIEDYAAKITLGEDNTQYTVVLIPAAAENATLTDADILYLNQGEKGELFWANMGTKAGTLRAGDYILRVGCEDGSIQEAKITVKAYVAPDPGIVYTPVIFGDITADDKVDESDASAALLYAVKNNKGKGDFEIATAGIKVKDSEITFVFGDVTADDKVDESDASAMLLYSVKNNKGKGAFEIGSEINVAQ